MAQDARVRISILMRALRVHQWVKNLLVFLPLFLAHRILDFAAVFSATLAFASFSLVASSVYLLNDILDIEADRKHHLKKERPIASGALSVSTAWFLLGVLLFSGLLLAAILPREFLLCLLVYYVLTCAYSFFVKRMMMADIVLLASLYAIRILAGGKASQVEVSQWLLVFSMFFFFSLACIKRFAELRSIKLENSSENNRRAYIPSDLEQIAQFGSASAYISVLVLALYINSKEVSILYEHPQLIWLCCPLLLYWLSRMWLLSHRGLMHEDPIIFAIRDRLSYVVGAGAVLILFLAT